MRYLVEALDTYERRNLKDAILKRTPKAGEQFEVNKERLDILLGNNTCKEAFVKVVKEIKEEKTGKNTSKKTTKSAQKGKNNEKENRR